MSLKNDFDEFIADFKKYPLWLKIVLGTSLFISASSITSLSDTIFEWKGFIKDGLDFYRIHISSPLRRVFRSIDLIYSQNSIDFITATILIWTLPILRFSNSYRKVYRKKYKLEKDFTSDDLMYIIFAFGIAFAPLNSTLEIKNGESNPWSWVDWFQLMSFFLFFIFLCMISKKYLKIIGPSLLSIIIVLILAAINVGLNK
ncbi:hypothetical protein [Flavivirga eckloniae]|uniref:Uncharacterized protein n=1 Tax=Flavivirga eckloniae TaxID=1803846 RepID=A0A2K9PK59_9FLAO|nr:hypothetical protein [Flavivirga eckloniae]AUP77449.1 hypothetical protein C1H87_01420 [Flavivirga eckloniae]